MGLKPAGLDGDDCSSNDVRPQRCFEDGGKTEPAPHFALKVKHPRGNLTHPSSLAYPCGDSRDIWLIFGEASGVPLGGRVGYRSLTARLAGPGTLPSRRI